MKTFSKPLTPEEEAYYLKEYHSGNEEGKREAKDVLTLRNLRLVAYVLKKYAGAPEDMEDMISCGTIGLIKAVNTYVPEKGTRLATYAARCIENEILMLLRGHKKISREVSLYESMGTDKVLNGREREIIACRYGLRTGEEVTQREVGEMMGISRSYVSRIEKRALQKLRMALEEKAEL